MKILHLGNIANNAYNNAKYLNQNGSHTHTVLNFDNPHVMACPEWEEVDTLQPFSEFSPDWRPFCYSPPNWYTYLETSELNAKGMKRRGGRLITSITITRRRIAYWLKDQGVKRNGHSITLPVDLKGKILSLIVLPIYALFHVARRVIDAVEWLNTSNIDDTTGYKILSKKLEKHLDGVDFIQAYGTDIIIPFIIGKKYIAYEHGTLRDLPFDGTERGRLLSQAYQQATHTIITNADVIRSAKKLNLTNIIYIPHSVDCQRFKPANSSKLKARHGITDELVIVAPARQNWDIKGNNKYIEGFAELLRTYPNSRLFVCDWGQHRDLTRQLIKRLDISKNVTYYSPCPKLTSTRYYQMADIVIDQFEAGAFGGITPEAMACEKPILVHYDQDVHEWCFESHPPVVNVFTKQEITEALLRLAGDPHLRQKLGKQGREWVLREYSVTQLVERHNTLYKTILS